jgi:hypothetical protein
MSRAFQFRLIDLHVAVVLAAGFAWTIPLHVPARTIVGYCLWSLIVAAQVFLSRWCRSELDGDPMRETAYDLCHAVSKASAVAWLLIAIAFGLMRGLHSPDANLAKVIVLPVGLWFPVCLIANTFSLLFYASWDAPRLFLFRAASVAAMLVPFVWLCVEAQF